MFHVNFVYYFNLTLFYLFGVLFDVVDSLL